MRTTTNQARTLLDRIPMLRRPCDIDLLVFFARHPRTLMTSEQLAQLLGHQLDDVARSLDLLLASGFLTRAQNPTRAARLHVFATGGADGGWLPAFVEFASTRAGRLALRDALTHSPDDQGAMVG